MGTAHTEHRPPASARTGRLRRAGDDRLIAGVAAGIAARVGVPVVVARIGFVLLALANGIGVVGYLAAWLLLPADGTEVARTSRGELLFQVVAIALLGIGAFVLLSEIGVASSQAILVPLVLIGIGGVVLWQRTESERRPDVAGGALRTMLGGRAGTVRLLVGGALVVVGVGTVVALGGNQVTATAAILLGVGFVLAPWLWTLSRDYMAERRERIRSEERADMAARLHDSVLQTLALIQRSADSPADTVRLARRQERELRSWLFDPERPPADESLRVALEAAVADVEELHDVQVELVMVGDAVMDDRTGALVGAIREALVNAAKFSGQERVSAFVEVEDGRAEAFVRDRGVGFDPDSVDPERHGITGSIVGRITRAGGTAELKSSPGVGTEVSISLPMEDS